MSFMDIMDSIPRQLFNVPPENPESVVENTSTAAEGGDALPETSTESTDRISPVDA